MTPAAASIARPQEGEYAPAYQGYIQRVPADDLVAQLTREITRTSALLRANADRADHAYAPEKWTVKEVIGHMCDSERVFVYRAMRFARLDETELPGFDENVYVANGGFRSRPFDGLIGELEAVRAATVAFARGLTPDVSARTGVANGKRISVRALLHIVAGHELHHVGLLRERYGLSE
jgi:hypothetical protein